MQVVQVLVELGDATAKAMQQHQRRLFLFLRLVWLQKDGADDGFWTHWHVQVLVLRGKGWGGRRERGEREGGERRGRQSGGVRKVEKKGTETGQEDR